MGSERSRTFPVVHEESMAHRPSADVRFRRIFESHERAIRSYCARRLRLADANDAIAEVFVVVWRRIEDAPPEDEARAWLFGIARNVIRNIERSTLRRRRLAGRVEATSDGVEEGPEGHVVRRDRDRAVATALASMRPDDAELLRLRTWEELTRAEIAEVFGITVGAVDMRLNRAMKRMAKALRASGYTPGSVDPPHALGGGAR